MVDISIVNGVYKLTYMEVSINGGTPKSSSLIGFSIVNHPFGATSIYGNPISRAAPSCTAHLQGTAAVPGTRTHFDA